MMLALLSIGSLQDPDAALDQAHGDGIAHAETLRQLGVVDLHDDGLLIQHDLVLDLGAVIGGTGNGTGESTGILGKQEGFGADRQAAGTAHFHTLHLAGGGDGEGLSTNLHQRGLAVTALEDAVDEVGLADEVCHKAAGGLLVDLLRSALLADNAVLHDDHLVGDGHGLRLVMGDVQGGDPQPLLEGAELILRHMPGGRAVIGIENNKPKAIEKIKADAAAKGSKLEVLELKSRYPQGAEKVIVYEATGRVIPEGKLPSDVGVLVMNVGTVIKLAEYIKTGLPLTSRMVTVDGGAVAEPKNV